MTEYPHPLQYTLPLNFPKEQSWTERGLHRCALATALEGLLADEGIGNCPLATRELVQIALKRSLRPTWGSWESMQPQFSKSQSMCAAKTDLRDTGPAPYTLPPHIAAFGKHGGTNDFGGHPSVRPCRAHLGGSVPFPSQAEVGDLQNLVAEVSILHLLEDQYWARKGIQRNQRVCLSHRETTKYRVPLDPLSSPVQLPRTD